jgi:hypothetical protein
MSRICLNCEICGFCDANKAFAALIVKAIKQYTSGKLNVRDLRLAISTAVHGNSTKRKPSPTPPTTGKKGK